MPAIASDSEMTVLAHLLEDGPMTARTLHAALAGRHSWAHSTVVTFLRRLEAKGLVAHSRRRGERAFVFRPTAKARAARKRTLVDALDRLFGGNPLPLVSSLMEEGRLKDEQIKALRRMIDERLEKGETR